MFKDVITNGFTLSALRSFLVVAEKGGYWPAAKGESGTAANLKNQVKRLADGLEVPLTQTQGRGIVLTARGQELQRVATDVLQLLSDFQRNCREERQLVRMGGGQAMFDELFVTQWPAIQSRLKQHRFQLHNLRTNDTVAQLLEQRIDFGLVRKSAENLDRLASHQVRSMTYALCVPAKLRKAARAVKSLKDLPRKLPMAVVSGDGELRKRLDEFSERHRMEFEYVVECNSHAQVRSFMDTGTVAALLPDSLVSKSPDFACFRSEEFQEFSREIMLVWNPERLRRMPEMQQVTDALTAVLGKDAQ